MQEIEARSMAEFLKESGVSGRIRMTHDEWGDGSGSEYDIKLVTSSRTLTARTISAVNDLNESYEETWTLTYLGQIDNKMDYIWLIEEDTFAGGDD